MGQTTDSISSFYHPIKHKHNIIKRRRYHFLQLQKQVIWSFQYKLCSHIQQYTIPAGSNTFAGHYKQKSGAKFRKEMQFAVEIEIETLLRCITLEQLFWNHSKAWCKSLVLPMAYVNWLCRYNLKELNQHWYLPHLKKDYIYIERETERS